MVKKNGLALKLADFQSPDPSPAYSSLFKLDHPIFTDSQRAGAMMGSPSEASLRPTYRKNRQVQNLASANRTTAKKAVIQTSGQISRVRLLARHQKKPLKISGLKFRGGDESSIEHHQFHSATRSSSSSISEKFEEQVRIRKLFTAPW